MPANHSSLKMLDSIYHAALRFVTNSSFRTYHCSLYKGVRWLSLQNRRLEHWHIFLFKAILHKLPTYLCSLLTLKVTSREGNLRSHGQIMYDIPQTRTVFGESAFNVFPPLSWYNLKNQIKLDYLPTMTQFKIRIKDLLVLNAHVLLLTAVATVILLRWCQIVNSFFFFGVNVVCVILFSLNILTLELLFCCLGQDSLWERDFVSQWDYFSGQMKVKKIIKTMKIKYQ